MKVFKTIGAIGFLSLTLLFSSCTDLKEEIKDGVVPVEGGSVDVQALLDDAYLALQQFQTQDNIWALQQMSSDETIGPTRGTDWDDNGVWRSIHDHTWDAENNYIRTSWNSMGRGLYLANNIMAFNPTPELAAQARFLRAYFMYAIVDHWGSVPTRVPGEDIAETLPTILSSTDATNYIISELEAILPDLAENTAAHVVSKNAARTLLAKMYLNKAVWTDEDRLDPSFDAGDMNNVIKYCDEVINSGEYTLDDDYYDNFRPKNDEVSTELIFTSKNEGGVQAGNVRARWFCTLHYNQNPSGWNGFTTIADFYDKFDDPNDVRLSSEPADMTSVSGIKAGFLEGQQFDADGNALEDRKGNPLSFDKNVSIFETGDNLEVTGVRVIKYIIDYESGDNVDNDYVLLRYADVLLMKAEAIARGGAPTLGHTAASLVDEIRARSNAAPKNDGSLEAIYDERGFEFYWEGYRRQDMVRFGTYLDAYNEKAVSEAHRVLFPYPEIELSANPNLKQNAGY